MKKGPICTKPDIPGAIVMAKATKCLLDISKALAVQFDISFTGNPNGQLLLLVSINRAPLTGFDAGGHLASSCLIMERGNLPGKPDYGPGNRIITH